MFGPNNFPYAFSGVAGGDFAAAIAAGNPVIAQGTSAASGHRPVAGRSGGRRAERTPGLPPATVQMIYKIDHQSGQRLVSDPRVGASAFTGSRAAGMALKSAADAAGKPIYLEMSSINPVVILPGALAERGSKVAADFASSCLMGGGQFCTNAGFVMLSRRCRARTSSSTKSKAPSTPRSLRRCCPMASPRGLVESVKALRGAGADLADATGRGVSGARHPNTLLRVTGKQFLAEPEKLQTEAFGSASLCVVVRDADEAEAVLCAPRRQSDRLHLFRHAGQRRRSVRPAGAALRRRVGRLLNDKMPTGVAVSPGDESRRAVSRPRAILGLPLSAFRHRLRRFGMLCCYDNVREHRLPAVAARRESERQDVAPD